MRSSPSRSPHLVAALLVASLETACGTTKSGLRAYARHDYDAAVSNWRPLAADGDTEAQFYLGTMYEEGRGVDRDEIEAYEWYLRAASRGHVDAQTNLGIMYFSGTGVVQSYDKAYEWFSSAARAG